MKTNALRGAFLDFFKGRGHTVVGSDSLIPSGDPTLLFTSAGMVQFKKHFLGQTRLEYVRAATAQKCLRTSDIERVGFTARHHTFFEMLGNFSFGDYFKADAVAWGWEFLTQTCGLRPEKLYPTVYRDDDESFRIWKKFVPESRITRLGEDSNFWNMGPTGPCGPCSEILYDQGESFSCGKKSCGPGCDCERYLEVWNLVFTQFDRQGDGNLVPLPQKNIDTGMGLERLSAVVNGLSSNFAIDSFRSLIDETQKWVPGEAVPVSARRIIADHIRACTFLIADGILPSNEGRGYVLRRLLRRSLRQGWIHGRKEPFLNLLVPAVVREMGGQYPELAERSRNIQSILETEEKNTLQTIESGTKFLTDEIRRQGFKPGAQKIRLAGDKVFHIYDTFGLDKEIQKEIVADLGGQLDFSEAEYEKAREKAVETARKGWKGSGEKDITVYSSLQKKTGETVFKAYDALELETEIKALLKTGSGSSGPVLQETPELGENEEGEIVLKETPFYAESGGQVGDRGSLVSKNFEAAVLDTQRPVEGLIAHRIKMIKGRAKAGDRVSARVDAVLRAHTMRHHTATHLLHAALRKTLGDQVTQAGSLVSPEKLRFDFTYPRALTTEQVAALENDVNRASLRNIPRDRREYSLEEARKKGALAFFGEKYGDKVFVVGYGDASTEVCGGTHCPSTGDVGPFKIVAESSVASGVRRIEALAGEKALEFFQEQDRILQRLSEKLKCSPAECPDKVEKLFQKQAEAERSLSEAKKKSHLDARPDLGGNAKTFTLGNGGGPVKFVAEEIEGADPKLLRELGDRVRDKLGSGIVLLASQDGEKASFIVTLTQDCAARGVTAGKIASAFAQKIEGKGGGKDLFAQGGGKNHPQLKKILESFSETLSALGLKDH